MPSYLLNFWLKSQLKRSWISDSSERLYLSWLCFAVALRRSNLKGTSGKWCHSWLPGRANHVNQYWRCKPRPVSVTWILTHQDQNYTKTLWSSVIINKKQQFIFVLFGEHESKTSNSSAIQYKWILLYCEEDILGLANRQHGLFQSDASLQLMGKKRRLIMWLCCKLLLQYDTLNFRLQAFISKLNFNSESFVVDSRSYTLY